MAFMLTIRHLTGSLAGKSQRLDLVEGQAIRLGRGPESDIRFSETLDDTVSTVHAELSTEGGRLYIEDKRSSNGTFLNGADCPAFQKIVVPDGSRIRLAQEGPELQVTVEGEVGQPAASRPPIDSSIPAKVTVGRDTLLREIDRAKQEERDLMVSQVARSKHATTKWMTVGGALLVLLIGASAFGLYRLTEGKIEETAGEMASSLQEEVGRNVWIDVERATSPAVAHIRSRFHLQSMVTDSLSDNRGTVVRFEGGEVVGSAVLIRSDLLLTAKHVVEPWKTAIDWEATSWKHWEEFEETTGITGVQDLLQIQFPGQQPITGRVVASAETSDLALISIPDRAIVPVPVVASNQEVNVTDEVAILGYPAALPQDTVWVRNYSGLSASFTEVKEAQPTFLRGTVVRPVQELGDRSHLFYLDAAVEPGNSGGPVVNREGKVVGIVSQRLEESELQFDLKGVMVMSKRPIGGAAQAVSPGDMDAFLRRSGVL